MRQRSTDFIIAGLALAVGLWAWVDANSTRREVDDETWTKVKARLASEWKDGDVVVVRPVWLANAAPRLLPHRIDLYGPVDDDFITHAGRIYAVTTDVGSLPPSLAPHAREVEERIGSVTFIRYAALSPRPVFAFRQMLHRARVSLHPKGDPTATGAGAQCGFFAFENWWCTARPNLEDWRGVGRRRIQVGGAERRWIWAHPHDGRVLRVVFPSATLGTKLLVAGGFSDAAVGPGLAAVDLRVVIDGQPARVITFENKLGVTAAEIATTSGTHEVAFEVDSANSKQRHFAFDAVALDESAGPPRQAGAP